ncbi:MAG: type II secretion system protein, partial [Actinomycetes bacterium]
MGERHARTRGHAGYTLVEILIGLGILAAIMFVVGLVSIQGTLAVAEQNSERSLDASSVSFVSTEFGRDVQAATGLSKNHSTNSWVGCGSATQFGEVVVSLELSRDTAASSPPVVTYWSRSTGSTYDLTRVLCRGGAADPAPAATPLVSDLMARPTVDCRPATTCGASSTSSQPPRGLSLTVERTEAFAYSLLGSPRSDLASPPTTSADPNAGRSSLLTTGGSSPLVIKGGARLEVEGNAFINSTAPDAVSVSGGGSLLVNGRFGIQQGGGCS